MIRGYALHIWENNLESDKLRPKKEPLAALFLCIKAKRTVGDAGPYRIAQNPYKP